MFLVWYIIHLVVHTNKKRKPSLEIRTIVTLISKRKNDTKGGLMEQNLTKLDVTELHSLLPEVISGQATINIGSIGHVAHGKSTVVKALWCLDSLFPKGAGAEQNHQVFWQRKGRQSSL